MIESLLTHALEYQARGWSVIPLVAGSKHPAIQWKYYQETAATRSEIEEWWGYNPDYNIGIVTGEVSDLLVVDVDVKTSMFEWDTLRVETPRGVHHYFSPDKWIDSYSSPNGISIRCQGAYVVAPPSLSSDGTAYAWVPWLESIWDIGTQNIGSFAPRRSPEFS